MRKLLLRKQYEALVRHTAYRLVINISPDANSSEENKSDDYLRNWFNLAISTMEVESDSDPSDQHINLFIKDVLSEAAKIIQENVAHQLTTILLDLKSK